MEGYKGYTVKGCMSYSLNFLKWGYVTEGTI